MSKNYETPAYGTISQNGAIWTVTFKAVTKNGSKQTGSKQGYNSDVFEGCPDNMLVIDWRGVDFTKVLEFASRTECEETFISNPKALPVEEYIRRAAACGAKVTTPAIIFGKVAPETIDQIFREARDRFGSTLDKLGNG